MLKACKDWNYPDTVTRSDVTMTTEEIFYEGDFLHMLLDKLSHLLDQVGTCYWKYLHAAVLISMLLRLYAWIL